MARRQLHRLSARTSASKKKPGLYCDGGQLYLQVTEAGGKTWIFRYQSPQRFARDVCRIVETRPDTTYDNFSRDFGERFVPGYNRPSTVNFLLNSPFKE